MAQHHRKYHDLELLLVFSICAKKWISISEIQIAPVSKPMTVAFTILQFSNRGTWFFWIWFHCQQPSTKSQHNLLQGRAMSCYPADLVHAASLPLNSSPLLLTKTKSKKPLRLIGLPSTSNADRGDTINFNKYSREGHHGTAEEENSQKSHLQHAIGL